MLQHKAIYLEETGKEHRYIRVHIGANIFQVLNATKK
jgi:hypothetical protein